MKPRKGAILISIIFSLIFIFSLSAEARNADLSKWIKNLSGTPTATERESYSQWAPEIVISGNSVHVYWTHLSPDMSTCKLYYRRSLDRGKTWEEKRSLFSNPCPSSLEHPHSGENYRRMAVSGNNVHIFQSYHNLLRYFRSTDGGATFQMKEFPLLGVGDIYASAVGNRVTVAYSVHDSKWPSGFWGSVYVMTSEDNGETFTHRLVVETTLSDQAEPFVADMQVSGDKIFVLYSYLYKYPGAGYDYGNKLFLAASTNRGQSFVTNLISVPSGDKDANGDGIHRTAWLQDSHYVPKIAIDGNNVYVVWCGLDFENTRSLFFRRSTNNGTTFSEAMNLTKTTIPGRDPRYGHEIVVAKAGKVYVLFLSGLHESSWEANEDTVVHFMRSLNRGVSFEAPKRINNSDYEGLFSDITRGGWWPLIKLDPFDPTGSKIHVIVGAMIYSYSSDSGATFKGPVRLDPYNNSNLGKTQMAISSDGAVHIVSLGRITYYPPYGDSDIFYRTYHPVVPQQNPIGNRALSILQKSNLGDGTGDERYDMMQIPASSDMNFTDAMTIEAWIKPNRKDGDEAYFVVKSDRVGLEYGYEEMAAYQLGQWRTGSVDARIATTNGFYVLGGGDPIPNDIWTHVAMTYDANGGANNFKVYVNGNLVGSRTATGTLLSNKKGPIIIGGGVYYFGYEADTLRGVVIDELRFWNRALSQEEIRANMRRTLTGTEANLVAYFPFNEPITKYGTVRDVTGRGNDGTLMYKESLTAGVEFPLRVITPNGGESIPAGINYKIFWQAPSRAVKFKLYYSTDNKTSWNYIVEVGNVREYNWQVPAQDGRKPQSFVRVVAMDSANQVMGTDDSDRAFAIEVLRVTSPNGGETLKVGNTHTITWQTYALTKTVARVQLQYSTNNGQTWTNIVTLTGNPGQYNWKVPNTSSNHCRVRVILRDSAGAEIARDISDNVFTIEQ